MRSDGCQVASDSKRVSGCEGCRLQDVVMTVVRCAQNMSKEEMYVSKEEMYQAAWWMRFHGASVDKEFNSKSIPNQIFLVECLRLRSQVASSGCEICEKTLVRLRKIKSGCQNQLGSGLRIVSQPDTGFAT